MDNNDLLFHTIVFEPPATSPDHRQRRRPRRHCHRRVPPCLIGGDWATESTDDYSSNSDEYSSSNSGGFDLYSCNQPRRHRHRHIHLPAGRTLDVYNALVRRPTTAAAVTPRNYGYRRLHYQGAQVHRGRHRTSSAHYYANMSRRGCGACSPQRNILVRCGRWLFGHSGRYDRGRQECGRGCCAPAPAHCGDERSRGRSPTRHLEEEYWGPGTQDWAYGPPGRDANWSDRPWSSGANSGLNAHNLETGAVVEEIKEGGTLPAFPALTDRTHNHYHMVSNGRSRRLSRRRDRRDEMRDQGVLALVNRERDRELDRNMVDRQAADRERDREFDRDMMDRKIAKQRDQRLLALLDREMERELNGAMVDRETTKQRDNRLLTLLDRERDRDRRGKGIMELLDQELERSRDFHPGDRSSDRSKTRLEAREESSNDSDEGLRAEIEALRNDFKKLMRSASTKSGDAVQIGKARRGGTAVSGGTSRSSVRQEPPADVYFTPGRTTDDEDSEDEDDQVDSVTSSRKVFENGRTETDQAREVPLPTDEASDTS